jgi:hypothetical protein
MLERDGYGVRKAFALYPLRIRLKLVLQRRGGAHARVWWCLPSFGLTGRVSPAAADVLDSLCVCRSFIHQFDHRWFCPPIRIHMDRTVSGVHDTVESDDDR